MSNNLTKSEKLIALSNYDEDKLPQLGIMRCRECKQYYTMQYWSEVRECYTSDWTKCQSEGQEKMTELKHITRTCFWKANFAFQIWWNIQCIPLKDTLVIGQYWQQMYPEKMQPSFEDMYLDVYNRAFNLNVAKQDINKFYLFM